MGRNKLNHVQYKRNIHPDFIDKMDKKLFDLKKQKSQEEFDKEKKEKL